MADTRVTMCGLEFKNPILSAADDFGSTARLARRVVEQGIGGLVSKTVHRIPGMGQWPRPWHFPIKKFGEGREQGFILLSPIQPQFGMDACTVVWENRGLHRAWVKD